LDEGANPNATENGIHAVQIAARELHPDHENENRECKRVIAALVAHGASLDLFTAVAIGDEPEVDQLVKDDPKALNARGPDGYPALHFAVGMNYKNIVAALLAAGCDVDIRNKSDHTGSMDETALHCAAFWDRYDIANLLIEAGADVNALAEQKHTPLHEAARMANAKLAELLLEHGANANAQDEKGQTPLDWCRKLRGTVPAIEKVLRAPRRQTGE
jgi:ankyrin repeat protein